jgi:hypothetical protein
MVGRFLDCCVVGSLALGLGLYFPGHEGVLGVGKAIQRDERRIARETKLKWTLYGQGYFSRRHGLYFLENGFLHVYGELTTNPDQRPDGQANVAMTDESSVQEEGERYLHEVYGLENGKWEKKLEGFSRPQFDQERMWNSIQDCRREGILRYVYHAPTRQSATQPQ